MNEPLLLVQLLKPIGVRVSPAAVWTTRLGEAELKSNEMALIPRSFSGNFISDPANIAPKEKELAKRNTYQEDHDWPKNGD